MDKQMRDREAVTLSVLFILGYDPENEYYPEMDAIRKLIIQSGCEFVYDCEHKLSNPVTDVVVFVGTGVLEGLVSSSLDDFFKHVIKNYDSDNVYVIEESPRDTSWRSEEHCFSASCFAQVVSFLAKNSLIPKQWPRTFCCEEKKCGEFVFGYDFTAVVVGNGVIAKIPSDDMWRDEA